ncbi:isochorismatase family protein [Macrococcoides canis]|nr:isochorismatase family protein [Macrococcus canis]
MNDLKEALIIVDYSYDFVAPDGKLTCGEPGMKLEPVIAEKWEQYVSADKPVYILMDLHFEQDAYHPESKLFPPHNIEGTDGRKLYGQLNTLFERDGHKANVHWIDKRRYSAFSGTPLDQLLTERHIKSIELTGVCTDICVLHTAMDGYNLGYNMYVDARAVASFNPVGHTYALEHFKNVLGMTVDSAE